ncbi:MAG TPA: class III signal peptide-containing protein [archaeon]|nr:class III signal peptide-containing protein [archaeon]
MKKTFLPSNGQGSLEYLLLIGGVLAVAAVVCFSC